jgi:thiol-disulfide isomerase/thioredoxin
MEAALITAKEWPASHRNRLEGRTAAHSIRLVSLFVLALPLTLLSAGVPSMAQTPAQPVPEAARLRKPADIYREAMHPLDVVRNSLDNWSDSELGALAAGMHQAREACSQAKPEEYSGDDLYDLARLCALGQDWNSTYNAAQRYIVGDDATHRARAYAMEVNALIQMGDLSRAVATTGDMLSKLPYDAAVSESTAYIVTYLEQALDPDALVLALHEHPAILEALKKGVPLPETNGSDTVSVGSLYESGMHLAFLERYAGADGPAAWVVQELKSALPGPELLSVEDQRLIQTVDTRYNLLGTSPPEPEILKALPTPTGKLALQRIHGFPTVLLLFPEWCTQCRRMVKAMTSLAEANPSQRNAAQTNPAQPKRPLKFAASALMFQNSVQDASSPLNDETRKDVQGTPTFLVSPATAALFGATEFPTGIVEDKQGKIVYIGLLPTNAFAPKGLIEEIVDRKNTGRSILAVIDTGAGHGG